MLAILAGALLSVAVTSHSAGAQGAARGRCADRWPARPGGIAVYDEAGSVCWTAESLLPGTARTGRISVLALGADVVVVQRAASIGPSEVVARDRDDGHLRWSAHVPPQFDYDGISDTDGIVVLPDDAGEGLVARASATGTERWRAALGTPTEEASIVRLADNTASTTPTSQLFVTIADRSGAQSPAPSQIVALDRATGAERWRTEGERVVRAAPATNGRPGVVVVERLEPAPAGPPGVNGSTSTTMQTAVGVDAADGRELWRTGSEGFEPLPGQHRLGVAPDGGDVVLGLTSPIGPRFRLFALRALDVRTGTTRWQNTAIPNVSDADVGDVVALTFLDTSNPANVASRFRAVDPITGTTRWERSASERPLGSGPGQLALAAEPLDLGGADVVAAVQVADSRSGDPRRVLLAGPWRLEPGAVLLDGRGAVVTRSQMISFILRGTPRHCGLPSSTMPVVPNVAPTPAPPSRYLPIEPFRLFDSRDAGAAGLRCPGERLTVSVTGARPVPVGASAIVANVRVFETNRVGHVSAWPGGPEPSSSVLNTGARGATRSNTVLLALSTAGTVDLDVAAGGHVAVDIVGYLEPAETSSEGRVVTLPARRLFDSRVGTAAVQQGALPVDVPVHVPVVTDASGVPSGASAAIVTLTTAAVGRPGSVTAWPAGGARPALSTVDVEASATVSTLAIVPIGLEGAIDVAADVPAAVVIDLLGYVTGPGATSARAGLIVPLAPARVFDSRLDAGVLPPGWRVSPRHVGVAGVPLDASAVFTNVIAIGSTAPTHLTLWPTGGVRPETGAVTAGVGETRSAAVLVQPGLEGRVTYENAAGHVAVAADVLGYVLGG